MADLHQDQGRKAVMEIALDLRNGLEGFPENPPLASDGYRPPVPTSTIRRRIFSMLNGSGMMTCSVFAQKITHSFGQIIAKANISWQTPRSSTPPTIMTSGPKRKS